MSDNRGIIRNRKLAQQIRDFSGLRYGKITPTDIDCFLDFGDKLFVFVETKHKGAIVPFGQRLALERLSDATESKDRKSLLLIAIHYVMEDEDINFSECIVVELRYEGKWKLLDKPHTVKEIIDRFLKKFKND